MIRTPTSCRQFLVRRWSSPILAAAETTASSSLPRGRQEPLSTAATNTATATATATAPAGSRSFQHLARGGNSTIAAHTHQHVQESSQSQHQPRAGFTPSQHFRYQNSLQNRNSGAGGQIRTVFIQTENTPNPESIKFLPSNTIVLDNEDGTGHFLNKTDPIEEILKSPLAKDLFKIDGVKAVYFGRDFVTVTKRAEAKWQFMRPEIFSALMDFFENPDHQVLLDKPQITDTTILEDDDEIVAMIKELIEDRIRPAVQEDGGDIHYRDFDEETGLVTVQLAGSCVGCPSSSITLKQGVENMLMHYIPEVTAVVAQEEEGEDGEGDDTAFGEEPKKQKSYEERLAAAGIPFSD